MTRLAFNNLQALIASKWRLIKLLLNEVVNTQTSSPAGLLLELFRGDDGIDERDDLLFGLVA